MCSHVTRAVLCPTREVSPLTQVQQSQQDHFIHCFKVSSKKAHGLSAPVTVRPHPFLARGSGDGHKHPELALRGAAAGSSAGSLSRVRRSATPWSAARQAPLSWGFSRQGYGVGCQALLQGVFPTQGRNPGLPHCRRILCHLSRQGRPQGPSPQAPLTLNTKQRLECSVTHLFVT